MTGALPPWPLGQTLTVTLRDLAMGDDACRTVPVGRLAWSRQRRVAVFEPDATAGRLPLSPHALRLDQGLTQGNGAEFGGLHGVFADSLPDGWGTLLVDREAAARGLRHSDLTPVDRLAVVGEGGMGALSYQPEAARADDGAPDVAALAQAAQRVLCDAGDVALADAPRLRAALGGSGGARPKIVCQIGPGEDPVLRAASAPPDPAFDHWIVKFPAQEDGRDIAVVEQAYATMARAAGIDMPPTRVVTGSDGRRFFAARRFDRQVMATKQGARLRRWHMLSASGALDSEHRNYAFDYATLLTWIGQLTRDQRAIEEGFRRAAFNAMAHNRDDHGRQHAALMDLDGQGAWRWRLSPAYDLTPSDGPGGEHSLAIGGAGRDVDRPALERLARDVGVPAARRDGILQDVAQAVADWSHHADRAGVPRATRERVAELHCLVP
ncbi:toxin HipA [Jannaschia pagri]|uniref:Toxin HipA n=1 Tax=Jannaschia pagri TaxID=2829797 RepID=A0ABQ4NS01_9RHOB|nr:MULTISPECIES: type II toxin-antitoxin system HipA family toxin [unclassified Jannaschia]GIT93214.1 toxin HipA [Jannaschia sp. AI_61]GIT97019.1 toxin HipA [Jannaschia sp. AI_62]